MWGWLYRREMPTLTTLIGFGGAALVLLLLPGPAVMYIVARSASQGTRAGLVSVAGIHLGTVVHIGAAMVGLSAILATSATAFAVVKLLGAGYLIWLGIRSLLAFRKGSHEFDESSVAPRRLRSVFVDGFVLNMLNPKTAIFFLSFVPQFVDADAAGAATQVAVFGAVFIGLGLITDGAYASVGGWLGQTRKIAIANSRQKDLVAGGIYLGLGLVAASSVTRPA